MVTVPANKQKHCWKCLRPFPFVEIEEEYTRYNAETEKAIKEARAGKGIIKAKILMYQVEATSKFKKHYKLCLRRGLKDLF